MRIQINNGASIKMRRTLPSDAPLLLKFLNKLSPLSQSRFQPHAYELEKIHVNLLSPHIISYLALNEHDKSVIAYFIFSTHIPLYEVERWEKHGVKITDSFNGMFAPVVDDNFQHSGIGTNLFRFMSNELTALNFKRIFLWGGVKSDNHPALSFYNKLGFKKLGSFQYHGKNIDMMLSL